MTVKEWRETASYEEKKELAKHLQAWLTHYTEEVYVYIMTEKLEAIINDPTTRNMLAELYRRQESNTRDEIWNIQSVLEHDLEELHTFHTNFGHTDSYRDVLYDMYIANRPRD